jgi:2-(1,2-epoxy-1,2-dihydrophenyl)acetyl-CoA isomerase
MPANSLLLRRDGAVAWLTLNRPADKNSLDLELVESLRDAVIALDADPTCTVLMITGAGRTFTTGGDVVAMADSPDAPALLARMAGAMNEAMLVLSTSRMIVVSVVNGIAAGAGLGIVLNSDITIAGSRAMFLAAFSKVGLTPDSGVSYLLPHAIGLGRAMELTLTGRMLRAGEALDWNLVSQVVPHDELMDAAEVLASRLEAGAAQALGETKRLLRGDLDEYARHLRDEVRTIAAMGATSEAQELISAQGTQAAAA